MTNRFSTWISRARPALAIGMVAALTLSASACNENIELGAWWVDPLSAGAVIGPDSSTRVFDTTGNGHYLSAHRNSTANVLVVNSAKGVAMQFPGQGTATLVVANSSSFNPGTSSFEVSASVSITPTQAGTTGSNIIQKGLTGEPQWKMQVDDGVPSCRFADTAGKTVLWRGTNPKVITSGGWYRITCRKSSSQVAIIVQRIGGPTASAQVKNISLGSITNTAPVTVGSKGTTNSPDQFRGQVDNLSFSRT